MLRQVQVDYAPIRLLMQIQQAIDHLSHPNDSHLDQDIFILLVSALSRPIHRAKYTRLP